MATSRLDDSLFANVYLVIYSKTHLRPLVDALGDSAIEMWVGCVRRTYEAHLGKLGTTKNTLIDHSWLCKLI